jgi:formylglycine-generating enzyme required for sulfatase activity
MHGNVYEWCEDVYKEDFYSDDVPGFDPLSTTGSGFRVRRGGYFFNSAALCRSADRHGISPLVRAIIIGFRPVRALP